MLKRILAVDAARRVPNATTAELPTTTEAVCGSPLAPKVACRRLPQADDKTHLPNLVTVERSSRDQAAISAISDAVNDFYGLREDRGQHTKALEAEETEIPLVVNWEEI